MHIIVTSIEPLPSYRRELDTATRTKPWRIRDLNRLSLQLPTLQRIARFDQASRNSCTNYSLTVQQLCSK